MMAFAIGEVVFLIDNSFTNDISCSDNLLSGPYIISSITNAEVRRFNLVLQVLLETDFNTAPLAAMLSVQFYKARVLAVREEDLLSLTALRERAEKFRKALLENLLTPTIEADYIAKVSRGFFLQPRRSPERRVLGVSPTAPRRRAWMLLNNGPEPVGSPLPSASTHPLPTNPPLRPGRRGPKSKKAWPSTLPPRT